MIPISLTFQGLYSYREPQTIDFSKLTSSQLFGIFGSIGSGKSSILEAIMFALYDQSDRLEKTRDNRYYNMMNLQSDTLEIGFEFSPDPKKQARYRVYFRAGRNRNRYDTVSVRDRILYRWEAGNWQPLEDKDATHILGMTYQNFMQTVIIPQGKFRDFVDQNPSKRTQMLKELFRLEDYELIRKTGTLLKRSQLEIENVQGQLSQLGTVSEEEIAHASEEMAEWEKALTENKKRLQEAEKTCQQQEANARLFEQLNKTEKLLSEEEIKKSAFEKREAQLKDYNRAQTFFEEKFKALAETRKEASLTQQGLKLRKEELKALNDNLLKAREQLEAKQQQYQQREQKEQQCHDLENAIKVRENVELLQAQKNQTIQTKEKLRHCQEAMQNLQKGIDEQEKHIEPLEAKLKRQPELQQLDHWHQDCNRLQQELAAGQKKQQEYLSQSEQVITQKKQLLAPYDWAKNNGSFDKSRSLLKGQVMYCRSQQEKHNKQLQDLQLSEKLASFSDSLTQGHACPLCGSTDHPKVAHHASVSQEIAKCSKTLEKYRKEEEALLQLADELNQLEREHDGHQQLAKQLTERQQELQQHLDTHEELFCWDDFAKYSSSQIKTFLQKLGVMADEVQRVKQTIKENRQQQQALEKQLAEIQELYHVACQKETEYTTSINNHSKLIRLLNYDKLKVYGLAKLQKNLADGRAMLKVVVSEYEQAQHNCQEVEKAVSSIRSRVEADQERLDALEGKVERLNNEIVNLCKAKQFSGMPEVQRLINLELNAEDEQEAINLYKTRLVSLQNEFASLQKESEGKSYSSAEHQAMLRAIQDLKQQVEGCHESYTLTRQLVKDKTEKLESCRQLQQNLIQLQQREANLKELKKLFVGSGFVKYVASVYLENLCRSANERFMQLTRNNLGLELNDDSEFIVRDYMNNGKTRLLKTLSGGQTFQAALCLALSLAENVKNLNKSEQSFFFLDEGFGSLDRESLRVVFETLKSLRQENRIVGIISHVEELQQEIDVFLTVENDKEKGSQIRSSWE